MHYKISFVILIYAAVATIDAILGIVNALNILESYLYRLAAATAIAAIFLYLNNKEKTLRPLIFISASLVFSIIILTQGQPDVAKIINTALKIAAAVLTLKPKLIEIEIIAEDQKESPEIREEGSP